MCFVKLTGLVCFVLAVCLSPYLANAQVDATMVLEAYGGDVALYESPFLGSPVLQIVPQHSRFIWRGERTDSDGRQWFYVKTLFNVGWISPDDGVLIFADPTAISPYMDVGTVATLNGLPNTIQSFPGGTDTSSAVTIGSMLEITDGPVVTNFHTWWRVSGRLSRFPFEGWLADSGVNFGVTAVRNFYGYPVCSNFNLRTYGVPDGEWESIVPELLSLIDPGESINCIVGVRMDGFFTPFVIVLTQSPATQQDTLRIFRPVKGNWTPIFAQRGDPFARTERLSLHDLTGDPYPTLLWNVRLDGTGSILRNHMLRYSPAFDGIEQQVLGDFYKGSMQIEGRLITFFQANYLPDEPNCCPSGVERNVFAWNGATFGLAFNDVLPSPFLIQSARR
ncbi:MAG: hypothetical protein NZ571_12390 [Anaerolineae bacterium]|nr:hypothetical protein [Anaerolineae bacterium]